jgi:3-methyladenine DNA glycosylase/8-oxoguanine DNA glycosylase
VVQIDLQEAFEKESSAVGVKVESQNALSDPEIAEIQSKVRDMLRLDEDLSEFYAICAQRGEPWQKMTQGLGRMLRSPTFFEDVVKTICTTNVQWGGTKGMVKRLVENYGAAYPNDGSARAFPSPEAIAAAPFEEFHAQARMGYRSDYVHLLARKIVSREVDLEAMKKSSLPTKELKKELLSIKGVGNYAAATLLMLVGRYDELAVDTVFRQFMREQYFPGQQPSDSEAMAVYESWEEWKYLAYWFDISEYYNKK